MANGCLRWLGSPAGRRANMLINRPDRSAHADRAVEWLCAGVMVWWCIALSLPGSLMQTPLFAGFANVGMTQDQWAGMFGVIGMLRCVVLFVNGRWPKTPFFRAVGAALGAFIFFELTVRFAEASLINHGPWQTGTGVYCLLGVSEMFSVYRAMHDARYYSHAGG